MNGMLEKTCVADRETEELADLWPGLKPWALVWRLFRSLRDSKGQIGSLLFIGGQAFGLIYSNYRNANTSLVLLYRCFRPITVSCQRFDVSRLFFPPIASRRGQEDVFEVEAVGVECSNADVFFSIEQC